MKTRRQIEEWLESRPEEKAFLRSEFAAFGKRSTVDKALQGLVRDKVLFRCGYGVLVRGRWNETFKKYSPALGPDEFSLIILRKLGIEPGLGKAARQYNAGESTQIPAALIWDVGKIRIRRRIGYNKRWVVYEKNGKRDMPREKD
ncbi:MAG: hypothetical protein M0Z68_02345 [Gammaproteobacteria bacterium]|nr:hypothetical protein [Gammaproteobacteria bacterium]